MTPPADWTRRPARAILASLAVTLAYLATPAQAKNAGDFYAGRSINLYIGYSVGGAYDLYGRLVARHLGRHIPGNPAIVPMNMDGAGSLKLMNWLYNAAPKDGSVIATVNQSAAFVPLIGLRQLARYDATKLTWIGSANREISVCVAWKRTGITKFDELYDKELIVGSTGAGADEYALPALVRRGLGARVRPVVGYAGGNDINYAMERGEVDGRCGWAWSSIKTTRPDWVKDGTVRVLVQFGLTKHPELPDVPLVMDFAKTEAERQSLRLVMMSADFGRPFVAPPGVPAARAAMLRTAFDKTLADPKFQEDAKLLRAEITPIPGPALEQLLKQAYATASDIVDRTRALVR